MTLFTNKEADQMSEKIKGLLDITKPAKEKEEWVPKFSPINIHFEKLGELNISDSFKELEAIVKNSTKNPSKDNHKKLKNNNI